MDIIRNFLNGNRSYVVGVMVYKTVGKDSQLKEIFAKGHTPANEQRLIEELEALLKPAPDYPSGTTEEPQAVTITITGKKHYFPGTVSKPVHIDDLVVVALDNKWKPLYQKMNLLRHELDRYQGNAPEAIAARKPIAFEILRLEKEVNCYWQMLDHYKEHGKLPQEKTNDWPVPEDPVALAKAIENCKRYIRRYRQNLSAHPDNANYARLFADYKTYYKTLTGNEYKEEN